MTSVQLNDIHVTIDQKSIIQGLSGLIKSGTFLGLIGPNGSGKTTLLKTIATILPLQAGEILIAGKNIYAYPPKKRAQLMSYVPQETNVSFDFQAKEVVMMGRHVHQSFFGGETELDRKKVEWALDRTETTHLANHSILSLSSGQRQLMMIAKALAQDTPIMLLDEPISALDIYHQLHILSLLKKLAKEGKTIIIVLHDLNLAARYCDDLILLKNGEIQVSGPPTKVFTRSMLKHVYGIDAHIEKHSLLESISITPFMEEAKKGV